MEIDDLHQRNSTISDPDDADLAVRAANIASKVTEIPHKIEKIASLAWKAVSFESLPEWLQDNEYLRMHHRPPMYSFRGCIKSIFRMHTETWNIWTHLIGFLFFAVLTTSVYCFRDYITQLFEDKVNISDLPWQDQCAILMFFLGAIACLFCSMAFHLLSNHSEKAHLLFSRLDYSGIAFLITGSSIPVYYYGFYCMTTSRYIHMTILLILCIACITVSLKNHFNKPKYRPLRFAIFVLFGLYGVIPACHMFINEGLIEPYTNYIIGGITMGGLYIFGASLYVLRVPERFCPGVFDVWAHSHQLFHICVVAAALVHYDTLLSMIKDRLELGDCITAPTMVAGGFV